MKKLLMLPLLTLALLAASVDLEAGRCSSGNCRTSCSSCPKRNCGSCKKSSSCGAEGCAVEVMDDSGDSEVVVEEVEREEEANS